MNINLLTSLNLKKSKFKFPFDTYVACYKSIRSISGTLSGALLVVLNAQTLCTYVMIRHPDF